MTSGGNAQAITEAKSYMTGAVIGIVILLSSVLLLNTVNPQILSDLQQPELPKYGICFYTAEDVDGNYIRCCYNESTRSLSDDYEFKKMGFRSIQDDIKGMYWFPEKDYPKGSCSYEYNQRSDYESDYYANSKINVSGIKSFYLDKNQPGVYLYTETLGGSTNLFCDASNFPHSPYQQHRNSKADLGDEYRNKVKAVGIRHLGCEERDGEWLPKIGYGAVLHTETDHEGVCSIIRPDASNVTGGCGMSRSSSYCAEGCVEDLERLSGSSGSGLTDLYAVGYESSAITPFVYDYNGAASSDQVIFYEEVSQEGDHLIVNGDQIDEFWSKEIEYPIEGGELGSVIDVSPRTNGKVDRILSIKIQGNLMIALGKDSGYSRSSFGDRCEVITNSVPNLKGHYVLDWPEDDQINEIGIVPLDRALQEGD